MDRKKLIIGAGPRWPKGENMILLDIHPFPGIDVVHDLNALPWPFEDGSMLHINATHVLEHLNDFPAVMDECWRLLHPGGSLFVEVPIVTWQNVDLAFADPTHKTFFRPHSFINYVTIEGVHNFGYCQHAWNLAYMTPTAEAERTGILRLLLFPIPDECLTDETLLRLCEKA